MMSSSNSAEMLRTFQASWNADRVGVFASVLCAIHCAATPFLLLILPTFGKVWSHPASHWLMALIVVPIALVMISKGYQRHRRKWIIGIGIFGVLFVLVGAVTPYFEKANQAASPAATSGEVSSASAGGCDDTGCTDSCCPSLAIQDDGSRKLHIPLASILTTIGGLFLIVTHIGNLCQCSCCKKGEKSLAQGAS